MYSAIRYTGLWFSLICLAAYGAAGVAVARQGSGPLPNKKVREPVTYDGLEGALREYAARSKGIKR